MKDPLEALRHLPLYEVFSKWYAGDSEVSTLAEYTGLKLLATEPGKATLSFRADRRFANAGGTLHGGVLAIVADCALGTALASTLNPGEGFATVEMKINFLKAVREQRLRFEGHVVQRGKTLAYVECDVTDDQGTLVARINATCAILRSDKG